MLDRKRAGKTEEKERRQRMRSENEQYNAVYTEVAVEQATCCRLKRKCFDKIAGSFSETIRLTPTSTFPS
jgi:hypothetical protein